MSRLIVNVMNAVPAPIARRLTTNSVGARFLRPFVNVAVPADPVAVVVRSGSAKGLKLIAHLSDEKYYLTGAYEEAVQQAMVRILRPGMIFWDVGAHAGFFTLLARRAVGSDGSVQAFEPMPENRRRLEEGLRLNEMGDVSVHPYAVAAEAGGGVLYDGGSTSMWTLLGEANDLVAPRVDVQCVTLDDLAEALPAPHLVKIDVEGAEVDVLRGGARMLFVHRPRVLIEFSNASLVTAARMLLPWYAFEQLAKAQWLLTPATTRATALHSPPDG